MKININVIIVGKYRKNNFEYEKIIKIINNINNSLFILVKVIKFLQMVLLQL